MRQIEFKLEEITDRNINSKNFLIDLFKCDNSSEVHKVIKKFEINEDNWKPFGRMENNAYAVDSQTPSPSHALAEKIVNSIDAMLTLECRKEGLEPDNESAPKSTDKAVEKYFNLEKGSVSTANENEKAELIKERNIIIATSGDKKKPSILVIDKGEGQHPDEFENTFLSLGASNKDKVAFTIGRFGAGSTASANLCEDGYQLIISRRNAQLEEGKSKK